LLGRWCNRVKVIKSKRVEVKFATLFYSNKLTLYRKMLKFKIGDKVKVTGGKDKGKDGVIEKIYLDNGTVLLPRVNIYKKHVKGSPNDERKGGIYDIPRPLPYSKIAVVCPKCNKQTRVGFKIVKSEKIRMCKKCGKEITTTKIKTKTAKK